MLVHLELPLWDQFGSCSTLQIGEGICEMHGYQMEEEVRVWECFHLRKWKVELKSYKEWQGRPLVDSRCTIQMTVDAVQFNITSVKTTQIYAKIKTPPFEKIPQRGNNEIATQGAVYYGSDSNSTTKKQFRDNKLNISILTSLNTLLFKMNLTNYSSSPLLIKFSIKWQIA